MLSDRSFLNFIADYAKDYYIFSLFLKGKFKLLANLEISSPYPF